MVPINTTIEQTSSQFRSFLRTAHSQAFCFPPHHGVRPGPGEPAQAPPHVPEGHFRHRFRGGKCNLAGRPDGAERGRRPTIIAWRREAPLLRPGGLPVHELYIHKACVFSFFTFIFFFIMFAPGAQPLRGGFRAPGRRIRQHYEGRAVCPREPREGLYAREHIESLDRVECIKPRSLLVFLLLLL
jgi:hypothetical protein